MMYSCRVYKKLKGDINPDQSRYLNLYIEIQEGASLSILANAMKPNELKDFFVTDERNPGEIFPLSKWVYSVNDNEIT